MYVMYVMTNTHRLQQIVNTSRTQEDDNKEYNKMIGVVEEKVNITLTNKKALLQLALASLIDTMKSQPDMYSNILMTSSMPTRALFNQNYFSSSINGQSQVFQDRYVKTYKSIVLDEAEKLHDKMVKELVTIIMRDLTSANGPPSSAPLPAILFRHE